MCMCAECFFLILEFCKKINNLLRIKRLVVMINIYISQRHFVPYTLNYLFAKLYCCITSNNGGASILKFHIRHFAKKVFKVI